MGEFRVYVRGKTKGSNDMPFFMLDPAYPDRVVRADMPAWAAIRAHLERMRLRREILEDVRL